MQVVALLGLVAVVLFMFVRQRTLLRPRVYFVGDEVWKESGNFRVIASALSPDGRTMATVSNVTGNAAVVLWDFQGSAARRLESALPGYITALRGRRINLVCEMTFSPDGRLLALGVGNHFEIWDVASGLRLAAQSHDKAMGGLQFSPDGKRLLATGSGGTASWRLPDGKYLTRLLGIGIGTDIPVIRMAPNNRDMAFVVINDSVLERSPSDPRPAQDSNLAFWNYDAGKPYWWRLTGGEVVSLEFSRDGKAMLAGGYNHQECFVAVYKADTAPPGQSGDEPTGRLTFKGEGGGHAYFNRAGDRFVVTSSGLH